MSDKTQLQQAIERIAKMEHNGVPQEQIAQACNIDTAKLVQLQETIKYKEALAAIVSETFDKLDVLNGGWDMVENLAMNKVVEQLQHNPDPDYSLKAAAFANKAVRRGKHRNETLGVQPNQQAIINVSLKFADKLQQTFEITEKPAIEIKKKDDNFLPPKAVTTLLTDKSEKSEDEKLMDELPDLDDLKMVFAS